MNELMIYITPITITTELKAIQEKILIIFQFNFN